MKKIWFTCNVCGERQERYANTWYCNVPGCRGPLQREDNGEIPAVRAGVVLPDGDMVVARPEVRTRGVIREVVAERARQDRVWGVQDHQPADWMVILAEEVGEVCRAILERDDAGYRRELVQVAAVAVAAVECWDRQGPIREIVQSFMASLGRDGETRCQSGEIRFSR